jgi:AcrR family transcriptional regulator
MGVYNHFDSKAGIVEALFLQGFERLREAMVTLSDIEDPLEALFEGGRRYRSLALANPASYRLMFLNAVPGFEPSETARASAEAAFGGLVTTVVRAMEAGIVVEGDPAMTSQMIWAACHGWVSLEICGINFVDDPDAGSILLNQVLVDGLRP